MTKEFKGIIVMTVLVSIVLLGFSSALGLLGEPVPIEISQEDSVDQVSLETFNKLVENNIIENNESVLVYDEEDISGFTVEGTSQEIAINVDENPSNKQVNEEYKAVESIVVKSSKSIKQKRIIKYLFIAVAFGIAFGLIN